MEESAGLFHYGNSGTEGKLKLCCLFSSKHLNRQLLPTGIHKKAGGLSDNKSDHLSCASVWKFNIEPVAQRGCNVNNVYGFG